MNKGTEVPRVIWTDNFDREIHAQRFMTGVMSSEDANRIADKLNSKVDPHGQDYYTTLPDGAKLFEPDWY